MKILIYGMQSSGASLFSYFLAQKPDSLAILDLWIGNEIPELNEAGAKDFIVKCTVNTEVPIERQIEIFNPDRTILLLRCPACNYASLKTKRYKNDSGSIDEKFQSLENSFRNDKIFDLTILYEDFVLDHSTTLNALSSLNFGVKPSFYLFSRSKNDICRFNRESIPWCNLNYEKKWSAGNVHTRASIFGRKYISARKVLRCSDNEEDRSKIGSLCPALLRYYDKKYWKSHTPLSTGQ